MIKNFYNKLRLITLKHLTLFLLSTLFLQIGIFIGFNYKYFPLLPLIGFNLVFIFSTIMYFWNKNKIGNIELVEEKIKVTKDGEPIYFDVIRLKYKNEYISDPNYLHIDDYRYFPIIFKFIPLTQLILIPFINLIVIVNNSN